ncbi:uncharacterized protein LOC119519012 isoform X3 [Choloepus didactylus]|uniref:uncharacterized protein LOC119519012 isoform X3 n=1 Tax=Choloepus didactylus TaxID=27675 RepID=UPI00189F95A2|nr:uncharacterized protein LOC119519012 isoform X3 [Choloepus didactylus]
MQKNPHLGNFSSRAAELPTGRPWPWLSAQRPRVCPVLLVSHTPLHGLTSAYQRAGLLHSGLNWPAGLGSSAELPRPAAPGPVLPELSSKPPAAGSRPRPRRTSGYHSRSSSSDPLATLQGVDNCDSISQMTTPRPERESNLTRVAQLSATVPRGHVQTVGPGEPRRGLECRSAGVSSLQGKKRLWRPRKRLGQLLQAGTGASYPTSCSVSSPSPEQPPVSRGH